MAILAHGVYSIIEFGNALSSPDLKKKNRLAFQNLVLFEIRITVCKLRKICTVVVFAMSDKNDQSETEPHRLILFYSSGFLCITPAEQILMNRKTKE